MAEATPSDPKAQAEQAILQKLTQVQSSVDSQAQLQRVLTHPLVREALSAEAAGKKMVLVEASTVNQSPPAEDPFKDVDFEKGDPKQLAQAMLKASVQMSEQNTRKLLRESLAAELEPLTRKLGELNGFANQTTEDKTKGEIAILSQKYANFDDLRQDMIALSKVNPNLSVDQLYKLSAVESGKGVKLRAETSSERGSSDTNLKSLRELRGKDLPKGSRGVDQLLEESLSRQDVSRFDRERR